MLAETAAETQSTLFLSMQTVTRLTRLCMHPVVLHTFAEFAHVQSAMYVYAFRDSKIFATYFIMHVPFEMAFTQFYKL